MKKETIENINKTFFRAIGMSYEEYEKLDFDEQQKLMSEYHKKHPNKDKETLVMIGGGDESIFMRVPKRWEQEMKKSDERLEKLNRRLDKEILKSQKLDFKTWLYLCITNVVIVAHPPVVEVDNKRTMYIKDSKKNEVFVFNNYEEYRNYYLMYLDGIEDEVIDLAIYTRGSKGQIVALKGLCEHIIVKKKINEFYNSITQEQIDEVHSKGKLTPLEAVQMWESFDLCVEGSKSILSKSRCKYFEQNCHECLMESASHKLEHEPIELVLSNSIIDEQEPVKKLTRDKK